MQQKLCPYRQTLRQLVSKNTVSGQSIDIQQNIHFPSLNKKSVEGIELDIRNNYLMSLSETKKYLYILFACNENQQTLNQSSKIVVWQFRKENGQNRQLEVNGIKGIISVMRFDMIRVEQCQSQETQKLGQNITEIKYKYCLIAGTSEGSIKIVDLQNKSTIKSTKLATKTKIIQILAFCSQENTPFYLFLLQNNQIQLINILSFDIIAKLSPFILRAPVEEALCMVQSQLYPELIYQATQGGYVIIWDLDLPKINSYMSESWQGTHKPSKRIDSIQPKCMSHEFSLLGMLYMNVVGELIMIVDKKCQLRLFSVDLEDRMDFVEVIKVQLPYFRRFENSGMEEEREQKFYDEGFGSTFLNFMWIEDRMSLYFMLEKEEHSVYRLEMKEWGTFDKIDRIKIANKHFKSIQQFVVNQTGQFLVFRNKRGFAIKCFEQEDQENQRESNAKPKEEKSKIKKEEDFNKY